MSLAVFPILIAYRPPPVPGRLEDMGPTVALEAAASSARSALAVARVVARTACLRLFRQPPVSVTTERARVGAGRDLTTGTYAYAFSRGQRVPLYRLPHKIDDKGDLPLPALMDGLAGAGVSDLVIDGSLVSGLTAGAVTAILDHRPGLLTHFFRPNPIIRKVLEMIGVARAVGLHAQLIDAFEAVAVHVPRPAPRPASDP